MPHPLHPPASRYHPAPLIDLASHDTRAAMSNGALQAFFKIAEVWGLRDVDARTLLGSPSNGSYYAMKKGQSPTLSEDRLRRVSYLVGIFKALNILHGPDLADRWITMPNTNRIFAGQTPLSYLLSGGLPAFETVRRLLDARRGGQ